MNGTEAYGRVKEMKKKSIITRHRADIGERKDIENAIAGFPINRKNSGNTCAAMDRNLWKSVWIM